MVMIGIRTRILHFSHLCKHCRQRYLHKAVVQSIATDPLQAIDNITFDTLKLPSIQSLPSNAVIIKVKSVAVHWVDLLMMSGQYQHAPPVPYTPGLEYAGEIVSTGTEVKTCHPGDQVYVDIFSAGPRSYGEYQTYGGLATHSIAPVSAVNKIPTQFDYDMAASFSGAYETSHHALVKCADVKQGETVLIHGATGASGMAAVQICSALGVNVIATGGSDEKLSTVTSRGCLGEGRVLGTWNYRDSSLSLREVVQQYAPIGKVDVVFDTVGGAKLSEDSLRCMTFGGRYCVVGWTSTPFAGGGRAAGAQQATANTIPTNLIMMKGVRVIGCPVAIHTKLEPNIRYSRVNHLNSLVEKGLLRPYVSHRFPFTLEGVKDALTAKWTRKVTGTAIVHPDSDE